MSKSAWGYVRLSQQGRDGSLEGQKEDIREYCRGRDVDLQTTRNEGTGTSGFDPDRKEYQLLREKIRNAEIDAVVVRDRARLSRDFDDRISLLADLRSSNTELHVTEDGGRAYIQDIQNAGIECLLAMMDHMKKMAEIQRSKDVVEQRIEDGCYQGKPPTGLQFADDGCHLEKTDRWDDVVTAYAMIEDGEPNSAICAETGFGTSKVSRMRKRGIGWYEQRLAEYGKE